jgi:MFS family permease
MISKFLQRILHQHHFWRTVGFDELSELYSAQLLRSLGISLIGLFTPIYLYTIGYSLVDIALYHVFWFMCRPVLDILMAKIIGRVGPKHSMLLAAFVHITYLGFLITLEDLRWPLLLVATLGSFAYGLHILAVQVDFSKIKHSEHGGKELGILEIMQKIGGVAGPLIGGLIANYFDPRYTIGLAMIVLLGSTIPLFLSSEPVRIKQKITLKGLNYRDHIRDYVSVAPLMVENAISVFIWPLFAAVFLLGDNTFAKLGLIAAISTAVALFVTHAIGSLIDDSKGRLLLRYSIIGNALLHLGRIFVRGPLGVLAVNVLNEPITAGYRMPYIKGLFDASDSLPGYRIAYLSTISAVDSMARLIFWVFVWIALQYFEHRTVLETTFVVGVFCSLAVMLERFPALNPSKR